MDQCLKDIVRCKCNVTLTFFRYIHFPKVMVELHITNIVGSHSCFSQSPVLGIGLIWGMSLPCVSVNQHRMVSIHLSWVQKRFRLPIPSLQPRKASWKTSYWSQPFLFPLLCARLYIGESELVLLCSTLVQLHALQRLYKLNSPPTWLQHIEHAYQFLLMISKSFCCVHLFSLVMCVTYPLRIWSSNAIPIGFVVLIHAVACWKAFCFSPGFSVFHLCSFLSIGPYVILLLLYFHFTLYCFTSSDNWNTFLNGDWYLWATGDQNLWSLIWLCFLNLACCT